jgi:hypothetical protein
MPRINRSFKNFNTARYRDLIGDWLHKAAVLTINFIAHHSPQPPLPSLLFLVVVYVVVTVAVVVVVPDFDVELLVHTRHHPSTICHAVSPPHGASLRSPYFRQFFSNRSCPRLHFPLSIEQLRRPTLLVICCLCFTRTNSSHLASTFYPLNERGGIHCRNHAVPK